MKSQVTHLILSVEQRRFLAMRSSQLGISLSAYVGRLIDCDATASGLTQFLDATTKPEVSDAQR